MLNTGFLAGIFVENDQKEAQKVPSLQLS